MNILSDNKKHMYYEGLGPQFELDDAQDIQVMDAIKSKEKNNGIVKGYHGTSESRAKKIVQDGFKNNVSVDQRPGVFAWDESMESNAHHFGQNKAREDGDNRYAIIHVEMSNPEPDYHQGRAGEWKSYADKTKVLSVEYFPLDM